MTSKRDGKQKTLVQAAIESLRRRAGQYRRWADGAYSAKADICDGAADRLRKKERKHEETFTTDH